MITYERGTFSALRYDPYAEEVMQEHWVTINDLAGNHAFQPDWSEYEAIEDIGLLLCVIARKDHDVIGYITVMIAPSLHCKGVRDALMDLVYIRESERKGWAGMRLFKEMENLLMDYGIKRFYTTCKEYMDLRPIYERMGYEFEEYVYKKVFE